MGEVKLSLVHTAHENKWCCSQRASPERCEPHVNHVIWKPPHIARGPPRVCAMQTKVQWGWGRKYSKQHFLKAHYPVRGDTDLA